MCRTARSLGPCLKSCSVPRSGVTEWSRWAPLVPGARAQLCRCEHAPGNCRPSLSLAAPFFITPRPGARQASFAEPLERRPAVTRSKLGLKNGAIVAAPAPAESAYPLQPRYARLPATRSTGLWRGPAASENSKNSNREAHQNSKAAPDLGEARQVRAPSPRD